VPKERPRKPIILTEVSELAHEEAVGGAAAMAGVEVPEVDWQREVEYIMDTDGVDVEENDDDWQDEEQQSATKVPAHHQQQHAKSAANVKTKRALGATNFRMRSSMGLFKPTASTLAPNSRGVSKVQDVAPFLCLEDEDEEEEEVEEEAGSGAENGASMILSDEEEEEGKASKSRSSSKMSRKGDKKKSSRALRTTLDSLNLDVLLPNKPLYEQDEEQDEEQDLLHAERVGSMHVVTSKFNKAGEKASLQFPYPSSAAAQATNANAAQTLTAEQQLRSSSPGTLQAKLKMEKSDRQLREKQKRIEALKARNLDAKKVILTSTGKRPVEELTIAGGAGATDFKGRAHKTALLHTRAANMHLTTRPDLYSAALRNFHRPRLHKNRLTKSWKIALRTGERKPGAGGSSGGGNVGVGQKMLASAMGGGSSGKVDMTAATGDFCLFEYVEEHPPLRLNTGMATAMINFYRTDSSLGEDEKSSGTAAGGGAEKKSRVAVILDGGGQNAEKEAFARLPLHVRLLLKQREKKQQYEHDANIPRLPYGETKVLGPDDHSPFLGNIETGDLVPSLCNNLFRAPIFQHTPNTNDFLLISSKVSTTKEMLFVLREIPAIFLVGQMEPLCVVPRPTKVSSGAFWDSVSSTAEKHLTLAVSRLFQPEHFLMPQVEGGGGNMGGAASTGLDYEQIQKMILSDYTRDRHWASQREQTRTLLQTLVSELTHSEVDRRTQVLKYFPKDPFVAFDDYEKAREFEHKYDPEELAKAFTPEEVCADEAAASALYRLRELGIQDALPLQDVTLWLERMSKLREFREARAVNARALVLNSKDAAEKARLDNLVKVLNSQVRLLDDKIEAARYVFDRLLVAPWNTTSAFVHSIIENDGRGRMELQGPGDPSGRTEGFAFVRFLQRETSAKKAQITMQGYYGSDRDLRKIKSAQAIKMLVALGCGDTAEIRNLKRWDRIALIRDYSTRAAASVGLGDGAMGAGRSGNDITKYARSNAIQENHAQKQEAFVRTCMQIWNRQRAALSLTTPPPGSSGEGLDDDGAGGEDEEDDDSDGDDEWYINKRVNEMAQKKSEAMKEEQAQQLKRKAQQEETQKEQDSLFSFINTMTVPAKVSTRVEGGTGGSSSSSSSTSSSSSSSSSTAAASSSSSTEVGSESRSKSPILFHVPQRIYPKQVVRRTIRRIFEDGTEEIRIQFMATEKDLRRVQGKIEQLEKQAARPHRQRGFGNTGGAVWGEDEEDLFARPPPSKINSDAYRAGTGGEGALAMKSSRGKQKVSSIGGSGNVIDVEGEYYEHKGTSSRGQGFPTYRLPHVIFAALLEKELMSLYGNKASKELHALWMPVPRDTIGYAEKIKQPICLQDIRENIASFKYHSLAGFLADFDLLVINSQIFNGINDPLTKKAMDIRRKVERGLLIDRNTLGIAKCQVKNLEEQIKTKVAHKSINTIHTIIAHIQIINKICFHILTHPPLCNFTNVNFAAHFA